MTFDIVCKCCGETFNAPTRKRYICQPCRAKIDPQNHMNVLREPIKTKRVSAVYMARNEYNAEYARAKRAGLSIQVARARARVAYAQGKKFYES